jgi:hypothetical protein
VAVFGLMVAVILSTGNMPSLNPGHPLVTTAEIVSYGAAGWFALWRLSAACTAPTSERF